MRVSCLIGDDESCGFERCERYRRVRRFIRAMGVSIGRNRRPVAESDGRASLPSADSDSGCVHECLFCPIMGAAVNASSKLCTLVILYVFNGGKESHKTVVIPRRQPRVAAS